MRFGWQGFRFDHPDDWWPFAMTGTRGRGFASIASKGRVSAQIRWHTKLKQAEFEAFLRTRFSRREREALRVKSPFECRSEWDGEHLLFDWAGRGQGRGALFLGPGCGRIFELEVTGARQDALSPALRQLMDTFDSGSHEGLETWALAGLDVSLPEGLVPGRRLVIPGRTTLALRKRGVRIQAERWACGSQLIARHGLEPWARAALRMRAAKAEREHWGIRLAARGREALVRFDEFSDHMILLSVRGKIRPEWGWIV